jgi:putative aldouronate transport system permease protein
MHTVKDMKSTREKITDVVYLLYRFAIIVTLVSLFIPGINPAKISDLISENMSLFTSAVSYSGLTDNTIRALNRGWITEGSFILLYISCIISLLGVAGAVTSVCMSLGSLKLRRLGNKISALGMVVGFLGFGGIYLAYQQLSDTTNPEKVLPNIPDGFYLIGILLIVILALSLVLLKLQPKPSEKDKYELLQKYKLFLLLVPFLAFTFLFAYLPLWGWRYAFFDYKAGDTLSKENFVGFKWFTFLFQNAATRADIVRVLKNTFIMSGLGLLFSWVPMAFAIFLTEIKSHRLRRLIQTFTTIPNFISWVLVYSVACIIFSSEGLISNLIVANGGSPVNFLMDGSNIWFKMFAWGMWKGVGWSAIIYIAGISGIDQGLYEAATVDGAGRFQRMWNITVPGLLPTFMVLLIMSVAGILSNGLDQYLVFKNANNATDITVLDLYVYQLGMVGSGKIPLSTVVGMCKSIISVVLLFGVNKVSKIVRGNSII